jgi:hypothetical protein
MSDKNLYHASRQWSSRPDDERFWTLEDLIQTTKGYRDSAREAVVPFATLKTQPAGSDGAELELVGRKGTPARLTHWAFGQLCNRSGAPTDYLRHLPASLAAQNLNHGLAKQDGDVNLLLHQNGSLVLRCLTSEKYSRIWDHEVAERLLGFEEHGWRVPPARPCRPDQKGARRATEADVLRNREGGGGLSVNVGDLIAPAGLYASDHDLFVFMVNESKRIQDGTEGGLSRGFFVSNSEVGAAALKVYTFLYRHVCGNHIVWGAENVQRVKIVHRGEAGHRFRKQLVAELTRYADASALADEERVRAAQTLQLGDNKEAVLETLFKHLKGSDYLPQKTITAGYETAEQSYELGDRTIDPRTAWGIAQGLTRHSQSVPYQDERSRIDRAAGKVLQMAF